MVQMDLQSKWIATCYIPVIVIIQWSMLLFVVVGVVVVLFEYNNTYNQ